MTVLAYLSKLKQSTSPELPVLASTALPVKQETAPLPAFRQADDLPEAVRAIRDERWRFCRDVAQLARETGLSRQKAAAVVAARDAANYRHLGADKLTYHNFHRWTHKLGVIRTKQGRDYNWENISVLADAYVRGKQPVRFDPVCFKIFTAMYLNVRRPTVACAYRESKELFRREFPHVVFPTKEQLVYQMKKRLPKNVILAGRYGIDYVENKSLYMLIRDWDRVRPQQCWFADSRPFDQLIRVPDDTQKCGYRAVRPDVTFIMDAASWYCVGFDTTGENVDSDMIRNTFARACVTHGRPEVFYIDNGKDYNKQGFTQPLTIEEKTYSIFQSLDIHLTNAKPYHGRSKTVERRFQSFAIDFDRRQGSYTGNSPANRPDTVELYYTDEAVMLLPTLGQFNEMLQVEIDRFHQTPLGGHLKGRTPHEVFCSSARLERAPLTQIELYRALLLPLPSPRQIHRGGCVTVGRVRYYAPELETLTGDKVIIKTSYLEPGQIHAYDLKGQYIAPCIAQSTTHPLASLYGDDEDKRQLAEQLVIAGRQRREVETGLKDATGNLAGMAIEDIKTLTRCQIESGVAPVTVAGKNKVKGGTHQLRLKTTPELAAKARLLAAGEQDTASITTAEPRLPSEKRRAFDEDFTAMMAGKKLEPQTKQGENYDDFQL